LPIFSLRTPPRDGQIPSLKHDKYLQKKDTSLSILLPLVRHTSRAKQKRLQEADMAKQQTTSQSFKSIVGVALVGLGLVILWVKLDGPAFQVTNLLDAAARVALELVPYIGSAAWQALQVYAFGHQRFSPCPLQVLVSFWPLLHVMAGAA
jgi:hypothetical protein